MNRYETAVASAQAPEEVQPPPEDFVPPHTLGPMLLGHARFVWEQRSRLWRFIKYGTAVFLLIAILLPNRYRSTTQLMPPDGQGGGGMMAAALAARGEAGGISALAGDILGSKSSGAVFVAILRSRTVQMRLVDRFDLRRVYWTRSWEKAASYLAEDTYITEDRKSGIITISVLQRDPQQAAGIAAGYVQELDRLTSELTTSSAHRERVFLEERLKVVKRDLDDAAQKFSQFASTNTAIDIPEQAKATVEAAARLQGELIAAQSQLSGLQQMYTDSNVRVRSARARMSELRKQLESIAGAGVAADSTTAAGASEDSTLYPSIRKLPLLGVTYADLYRRIKIQEAVFEVLTKQYEVAKVQEAKEIPTVKVLDGANVPERKSSPPRTLIVLLGVTLSLAAGIVWILGLQAWSDIPDDDRYKQFAIEIASVTSQTVRHAASRLASKRTRPPAPADTEENLAKD